MILRNQAAKREQENGAVNNTKQNSPASGTTEASNGTGAEPVERKKGFFTRDKKETETVADTTYGKNLSFAAAEAYRLLRTNLMFALPDEQRCRVIGITSANAGEGKSTTALNLSYMLAEADKRVMLVEADMRLPSISKRLRIPSSPGLSNLLAGLSSGREITRKLDAEDNLIIIPSGDIPPNPSELLGSDQMKTAVEVFSQAADFIILDLPPINEVSDALVVSRLVDGLVMVVRQNYANRRALAEAMRQLEQANAKMLGFVMTAADTMNKWSGYKGKYKSYYNYKYGYRRGYGYRSRYAEAGEAEQDKAEKAKVKA